MSYRYILLFRFLLKMDLINSVNDSCSVKFNVLEGNMFWLLSLLVLRGKALNFLYVDQDPSIMFDLFPNDLKWIIILVTVGVIIYLLWN
jgi:hypothetical protein